MFSLLLRPFFSYKYLLFQLTQREIKARYKQSFVGYAWVILNPLAQLFVYAFVFSTVFRFPTNNVPYPVFLFATLLPWTFFQQSLSASTMSLVDNSSLLRKVAFPREIVPYASIFSKLVDFGFTALVFILFMFIFKVSFAPTTLLFFPIFAMQLVFMTGLALILSCLNLFFRDIQYLSNLLLMLWMYMTPIVYPVSMVPEKYVWWYKLNPMVGIMEGYRSAIFGYSFEWQIIAWSLVVSVVTFIVGFILFKKSEKVFADIA